MPNLDIARQRVLVLNCVNHLTIFWYIHDCQLFSSYSLLRFVVLNELILVLTFEDVGNL